MTLTESVNKSTTRQSEVTSTARRKTKNTEEENTSMDFDRVHVNNSNPFTGTVSFVTYNIDGLIRLVLVMSGGRISPKSFQRGTVVIYLCQS